LLNTPKGTLDQLVHSEITFYGLQQNPQGDGLGVIGAYTKILDALIESFLTHGFRKYCQKNGIIHLQENSPLEKALHLVVNKKYQLSIGRLFGLLKARRAHESVGVY
jgi:hypothetical protein